MNWRKLIPHPLVSIVLLITWLMLNDSVAPGHWLLGAVLGVSIPMFSRRFWRERVVVRRPDLVLRLGGVVLADIVTASFSVAGNVLGFGAPIRPGFVRVPLATRNHYAIATLANIVSMTPGTVSADVDASRSQLLVHSLDIDNPEALVALIKQRYEAPLLEILP